MNESEWGWGINALEFRMASEKIARSQEKRLWQSELAQQDVRIQLMVSSVKRIPVQRAGRALIQEVSESCFYAQSSQHILKPSLSPLQEVILLYVWLESVCKETNYKSSHMQQESSSNGHPIRQQLCYNRKPITKATKTVKMTSLPRQLQPWALSEREMAEAIARETFTRCELRRPWTKEENTVKSCDGQTKGTPTESNARQCNLQWCNYPHDSYETRPRKFKKTKAARMFSSLWQQKLARMSFLLGFALPSTLK